MPEENRILIIREYTRKNPPGNVYAGKGSIQNWKRLLGKEPTAEEYSLTQITTFGDSECLKIRQESRISHDNYKQSVNATQSTLILDDERSTSALLKFLTESLKHAQPRGERK